MIYVERDCLKRGESPEAACIAWTPEGDAFIIRNYETLTKRYFPVIFRKTKFSSFTRKLYRWGFRQRLDDNERQTPDCAKVFFHQHFQRGNKRLLVNMRSTTAQGSRRAGRASIETSSTSSSVHPQQVQQTEQPQVAPVFSVGQMAMADSHPQGGLLHPHLGRIATVRPLQQLQYLPTAVAQSFQELQFSPTIAAQPPQQLPLSPATLEALLSRLRSHTPRASLVDAPNSLGSSLTLPSFVARHQLEMSNASRQLLPRSSLYPAHQLAPPELMQLERERAYIRTQIQEAENNALVRQRLAAAAVINEFYLGTAFPHRRR